MPHPGTSRTGWGSVPPAARLQTLLTVLFQIASGEVAASFFPRFPFSSFSFSSSFFSPWRKYCSLWTACRAPWRGSLSSTHWLEGGEVSERGARPAGTHHVTLGTRQQQLSLHGFLFLFFIFSFSFSFFPSFFLSFLFLFAHCFFSFLFIKIYFFFHGGKETRERRRAVTARIPSCAKGFFFSLFFFLLLRLHKRLRLTPLETGWLQSKLLHPDWTGQLGGTRQAKTGEAVWGFRYGSQPPSLWGIFGFCFLFLFSFGSFVLLCFGFFWLF